MELRLAPVPVVGKAPQRYTNSQFSDRIDGFDSQLDTVAEPEHDDRAFLANRERAQRARQILELAWRAPVTALPLELPGIERSDQLHVSTIVFREVQGE